MNIKITSDSTCDLSPELLTEHEITIIPLTVVKDGINYRDGVDIIPTDIFAHVDDGGTLCSTAAVNVYEYGVLFEQLSKKYDAVVHINLGSGFSSCYQNACIAAGEFPNVYVIDSQNLSTGHGHVVMEACRLAKDCDDVEELCTSLRELTSRIEASFLLNRLDYMVKGGRCSTVKALGASLLNIKPCIEVSGGRMQVVKKYRGTFDKCLASYTQERLENRNDIIGDTLFLTHTLVEPSDIAVVKSVIAQHSRFEHVYDTIAGCTVSCHCGPGTLGVLFIRKPN